MSSDQRRDLMKQWEFFNALVTARDDNLWRLGSIFVPTSFLIFSSAIVYRDNILNANGSYWLIFLLFIASITCYFFWGIFYLRTWVLDQISIHAMKDIEARGCFKIHWLLYERKNKFQITNSKRKPLHWFLAPPSVLVASWIFYFGTLFLNDWNWAMLIIFPLTLTVGIVILVIFYGYLDCNVKSWNQYKKDNPNIKKQILSHNNPWSHMSQMGLPVDR